MYIALKKLLSLSLLACGASQLHATNNRMFYTARPHLANMPLLKGTFASIANQDNPGFGGTLQLTPFFEQSTDSAAIGRYFSFTDNNSFTIKGNTATNQHNGYNEAAQGADALPGNFGLDAAYEGTISFNPRRTSYGMYVNYQQDFLHLVKNVYLTATAPIVSVSHTMGLNEEVITNPNANNFTTIMAGGQPSTTMNAPLNAGKINNTKRLIGLADIDLGLGYRFIHNEFARLQGEIHLTIPTGTTPTGNDMFEVVIGNNGHWALGGAVDGRINLWTDQDNDDHRFSLWLSTEAKYLFENHQTRTLGLANNPGGQFITMRQQDPAQTSNVLANAVFGPNAMTRQVSVTPGLQVEGMVYGDYTWNSWKLSMGYNIFGRQSESVALKGSLNDGGIYGLTGPYVVVGDNVAGANYLQAVVANNGTNSTVLNAAGNIAVVSADGFTLTDQISAGVARGDAGAGLQGGVDSRTTLKQNGVSQGNPAGGYVRSATDGLFIQEANLDMLAQQQAISNKVIAQVTYALDTDTPGYVGIGGGYEIGSSNDLMSQWQVWCKFGITF